MLSRRGLFTTGLSRLLPVEPPPSQPPWAPAVTDAAVAAPRAWPRGPGADLWAAVRVALHEAVVGADVFDLDADPELDLASLPFDDGQFGAVMSAFGPMFSSDGRAAIDELFRVVRPGGTVAFAAWTPLGVVGRLLRLGAAHEPRPPGVPAPLAWGREELLRQELERHCEGPRFELAELPLEFDSPAHAVQRLVEALGPLAVAPRQEELRAQVADGVDELAEARPGGVRLRASYLVAIGERRPVLY